MSLGRLVSQIHHYLPSLFSACKMKSMVDQKQKWIADSINEVNTDSDDNLFLANGNDLIQNPEVKKVVTCWMQSF